MRISLFDDAHRLACRRQHRVLGQYLALQAWVRGLDCIVLEKRDLEHYLGLERMKETRVQWVQDDLTPWFPHQEKYEVSGRENSLHSLFLARAPIVPHLPTGTMSTAKRIAGMAAGAPKTGLLIEEDRFWPPPTEQEIISQLAVLSAGLAVPQDFVKRNEQRQKT